MCSMASQCAIYLCVVVMRVFIEVILPTPQWQVLDFYLYFIDLTSQKTFNLASQSNYAEYNMMLLY